MAIVEFDEIVELEKVVDQFNAEYVRFIRVLNDRTEPFSTDLDDDGLSPFLYANQMRLLMANMAQLSFNIMKAKVTCRSLKKPTREYIKLLNRFSKEWDEVSQTLTLFWLSI